jgi:protoporphyrin/coproporphyrin ferrochelatase
MAVGEPLTGVLCMAYGSPARDAEIEAYYTSIRGGRKPTPEALAELKSRYGAIGRSSLTAITQAQAAALEKQLGLPVFVGMKHAAPFIEDGAAAARAAGIERLVGLPLAPHYSRLSVGSYERALNEVWDRELIFIRGFHSHPAFIAAVRGLLSEALAISRPERIYFTAHSLPARIVAEGDPYREQLLESCRLVAAGLDLPDCEFAFQSASKTGEPWLGPDVLEVLERARVRDVLVCPIGFVADHLEILYDLDLEARAFARERGIRLRRTASFNARPDFIAALAAVVLDAIEKPVSAAVPAERA